MTKKKKKKKIPKASKQIAKNMIKPIEIRLSEQEKKALQLRELAIFTAGLKRLLTVLTVNDKTDNQILKKEDGEAIREAGQNIPDSPTSEQKFPLLNQEQVDAVLEEIKMLVKATLGTIKQNEIEYAFIQAIIHATNEGMKDETADKVALVFWETIRETEKTKLPSA